MAVLNSLFFRFYTDDAARTAFALLPRRRHRLLRNKNRYILHTWEVDGTIHRLTRRCTLQFIFIYNTIVRGLLMVTSQADRSPSPWLSRTVHFSSRPESAALASRAGELSDIRYGRSLPWCHRC